ncbi:MAG: hypothetical protein IKP69_04470, partial [Oscillospiraceae bacterium]|nr:hypothetical protein [Oscillospiraceae bacterium]
ESLELKISELEEQLSLPEICSDYQKMQQVCAEMEQAKSQSELCFTELCELEDSA